MRKVKKNTGPKVARAYIRVSYQGERGKVEGKGEFMSPDLQNNKAKEYVKLHLPEYIFDEDASRANMDIDRSASRLKWQKREGLVAHLEAARNGEFNVLLFYKLSRFARNAKEGLELYDEFEQAGCSVISVMDNIDTTTTVGKLLRTVLFAVAEMESDNISDWVSAAFLQRVRSGLVHGRIPFWITKNDDGTFIVNERVDVIRRLVDLRLAGLSSVKIARTLNSEGLKSSTGKLWTNEQVRLYLVPDKLKLLQGHFVYGLKRDEGDPGRLVLENAFPAVITQEEAETVDAFNRQQKGMWSHGNPRKSATTTYILSGLIFCAHCGSQFRSRSAGKPLKGSYSCKRVYTNNVPHPVGKSVVADMLEDAVLRVVRLAVEDYIEQIKQDLLPKPVFSSKGATLDRQMTKITESITRLSELFESGIMKREDFERRYNVLVEERDKLREQMNETDSQSAIRLAAGNVAIDITNDVLTKENARRLVLAFVERIDALVEAEVPVGKGKTKTHRAAWVTLKIPLLDGTRRILAPLYDPRYDDDRILLDRESSPGVPIQQLQRD